MNKLIAEKLQLYNLSISPQALQYLITFMNENQENAEILLDTLFTQNSSFDFETIKQTLQRLQSIKNFNPLSICKFSSLTDMQLKKYNQKIDPEEKITRLFHYLIEISNTQNYIQILASRYFNQANQKRPLDQQFSSDDEEHQNKKGRNLNPENEGIALVPSINECLHTLKNVVRLQTLQNDEKQLHCAACIIIDKEYIIDGVSALRYKKVCNLATVHSFISQNSIVMIIARAINDIVYIYAMFPPPFFNIYKTVNNINKYKIPLDDNTSFLVVKNIQSKRNLQKLDQLAKIIQPLFILFIGDYIIQKNQDVLVQYDITDQKNGVYTYPSNISQTIIAINTIVEQLSYTECVFLANQYCSVTPEQCFEQIPIHFDSINADILSSPCYIQFGNTQILVQPREIFSQCKNQANEDIDTDDTIKFVVSHKDFFSLDKSETNGRFGDNIVQDYNDVVKPKSITISGQDLQDTESDIYVSNNLIPSYYMSYLQQQSICPVGISNFNVIYNKDIQKIDCIITAEQFQKYNCTICGIKCLNACDFENGVMVVFGMDQEVGSVYLDI